MVNNIGMLKNNKTLNPTLGGVTTPALISTDIDIKTGELGTGCLLFDNSGTIGVISNYVNENDFTVTTYALSIDINSILSLSY